MFDNATSHMKYAEYALRVSKINLEDGGKNAKPMRTLLVVNLTHPENGRVQSMVRSDGTPKRLQTVLPERNLWQVVALDF